MRRLWCGLGWLGWGLLLAALPAALWAQGKGNGVEVRATSAKVQDATPGRIMTLSFAVTSAAQADELFNETLTLPEQWQAITPPRSFTLRPGQRTTRLIAFQVPLAAVAGKLDLSYAVHAQRDNALTDSDMVTVVVQPVSKLSLVVEENPENVIAGDPCQLKLRLANQGNIPLTVALTVKSIDKYPATVEPAQVTLAAGQRVPLVVSVKTDSEARAAQTVNVDVKASCSEGGRETEAAVTAIFNVVARVSGNLDMTHHLPAELALRLDGQNGGASLQAELRGAGSLDEAGTKRVDFGITARNMERVSSLGEEARYYLNYDTDELTVSLGDESYNLSNLTSTSSYGRGLGVAVHDPKRPTAYGAFYVNDRSQAGAYFERKFGDRAQARLNVLHQQGDAFEDGPASHDTLYSIEAELKPNKGMTLQGEFALSNTNLPGGRSDHAYRVNWQGNLGRSGYYQFNRTYAGPGFRGYSHNSDYFSASASYALAARLQGHLSYSSFEDNLDLRAEGTAAQSETQWRGGLSYTLAGGWDLSLDYDQYTRLDRLLPADYNFSEQGLRLGVGHSSGKLSYRGEARVAGQQDRLIGQTATAFNYNLYTTYTPRPSLFFTTWLGFGTDAALDGSRLLGSSDSNGASLSWNPRADLSASLSYSSNSVSGSESSASEQYNLSLRHTLRNAQKISLEVRRMGGERGSNDTSYVLAYTIPLSIPLGMKTSVGCITGRICDSTTAERKGVSRAIVGIGGRTAVTDDQGGFAFGSMEPGMYELLVERASVGLNRVTEQKMPLTVEVRGGKTARAEIGLVPSASVTGKVVLMPPKAAGNGAIAAGATENANGARRSVNVLGEPGATSRYAAVTGLANVLVELSHGEEVLRRLSDERGAFSFESLRPGTWRLKIYEENLPAYYYLETKEQSVELQSGQVAEYELRVLPKARQIRFIDQGPVRRGDK